MPNSVPTSENVIYTLPTVAVDAAAEQEALRRNVGARVVYQSGESGSDPVLYTDADF
jgi:hypothetical protein